MPKPVLLTVDDDPEVLRAIERDLRGHYAQKYRVMRADSGSAGLSTLRELKARNNPVALLLADQRMPSMDGVGFLAEAMDIHPQAKRALLTAYADTNAAIDAINEAKIHYYLMKPWDPPEEKLFPALDDLLHDWNSQFRPPYEGIRVLGTRWSSRSYDLRDFMARNQVPYQWIDVELAATDPEVRRLIESLGPELDKMPLILFPDGERIAEPSSKSSQIRSAYRLTPRRTSTTLLLLAEVPQVSRQPCMAHRRACAR
jgi:thioredoxin reductase (NADPH)